MDLKSAIISVIAEQKISTQSQLVEALKLKNVHAEQSTISRQFKKLDVYKTLENGQVYYKLMQPVQNNIKSFVKSVNKNECLIVIKTNDGAANIVGDFIDKLHLENILGSIAGDNTLFISTDSVNNINKVYGLLFDYLT